MMLQSRSTVKVHQQSQRWVITTRRRDFGRAQPFRVTPDCDDSATQDVCSAPLVDGDHGVTTTLDEFTGRKTLQFKTLQRHFSMLFAGNTQHDMLCVTQHSLLCSGDSCGSGRGRVAHFVNL